MAALNESMAELRVSVATNCPERGRIVLGEWCANRIVNDLISEIAVPREQLKDGRGAASDDGELDRFSRRGDAPPGVPGSRAARRQLLALVRPPFRRRDRREVGERGFEREAQPSAGRGSLEQRPGPAADEPA